MSASLYHILAISRQDMLCRLQDLDGISNNIANVNTPGYRHARMNFQELLGGLEKGGQRSVSTQILQDQGSAIQTNNSLDLAINGEGFFAVTLPDGRIAYTRDGQFIRDEQNQLVNGSGYPVVWDGEIPPEAESLRVDSNGAVWASQGENWTQIGTIGLYRFQNPSALQIQGQNLFLESVASGPAVAGAAAQGNFGQIIPGYIEASNVNMGDELTHLISVQRAFQVSSRTFQQTDTMIGQAINMRRA